MHVWVRLFFVVLVATAAGQACAQFDGNRDRQGAPRGGRMTGEERQRLRDDLRRQQASPGRATEPGGEERARRYAEWQRLSPEQREGIRRDMRNANRSLDRRRR